MKKRILAVTCAICCCMLCACGRIEEESSTLPDDSKAGGDGSVTTTAVTTSAEAITTTEPQEAPPEPDINELVLTEFYESDEIYSKVSLVGALPEEASIEQYTRNVLHNDVVGLVGTPFMVELGDAEATLEFTVTDEALETVPLENLIVLWYNEEECYYEELYTESDIGSNKVSAEISESGVYMLTDWFIWGAVWGIDTSDYAHDTVYHDKEYGFKVTVPSFVKYSIVSDYWKEDGDEETQSKYLLRTRGTADVSVNLLAIKFSDKKYITPLSDKFNKEIEYIKRINEEYPSDTISPLEFYGQQELDIGGGKKGYMVSYGFLDPDSGKEAAGSIWCYYEYSDDTFISLAFNYSSPLSVEQKEAIAQAIMSFSYTG